MATHQDYILAPQTVTAEFGVEPAANFVSSLYSLQLVNKYSGLGEWVTRTAASLKPRQKEDNFLITEFCFEAIRPKLHWDDIPSFLEHLETLNADALRDGVFDNFFVGHKHRESPQPKPKLDDLLNNLAAFETLFYDLYGKKRLPKKALARIHRALTRPEALKQMLIDHLHWMWEHTYRQEWQEREPLLEKCVFAFRQVPLNDLSAHEMVTKVIGRELNSHKYDDRFETVEHIVFSPSPHIGPYALIFKHDTSLQVMFGARLPEGFHSGGYGDLDRSDLLTKLSALVDDTRLKIVELLTVHPELSAQDMMEQLDQSQSSISRHLIQLQSTGMLEVRREARGKKMYRLNPARVQSTLQTLTEFLRAKHH